MRASLILAAASLALAGASPAHAFIFGRKKPAEPQQTPTAAPQLPTAADTPQVKMPGEVVAGAGAPAAAPMLKPATPAERAAADKLDLMGQATFWVREHTITPGDREAAERAVAALRRINSQERAAEIAGQAVMQHRQSPALWADLGLSLAAMGQGSNAALALREAIRLNSRDARLHSALGVALDQMNQPEQARAAYTEALRISPNDPNIMTNLGLSYVMSGDLPQAEATLRRAAAAPGAGATTRQNLSMVLGLQGKFDEAERLQLADLPPQMAAQNMAWLRAMTAERRSWDSVRTAGPPATP
jgi:Flp pilus assembly protein TadD